MEERPHGDVVSWRHVAQRAVRGSYRRRGESLGDANVVASKTQHYNTGVKSVSMAARSAGRSVGRLIGCLVSHLL